GRPDVILSDSEEPGKHITWYSSNNPTGGSGAWTAHQVSVVDYAETLHVADVDKDGDLDIIAGTLKLTNKPHLSIFKNHGNGSSWTKETISNTATYKGAIGDIDNDGDLDIVSSLSWVDSPITLYRNLSTSSSPGGSIPLNSWKRHVIDSNK